MVKWDKIENNKVKMEIELPENEVDTALDKAYHKVVKKVNLPGFRKGKIPRKVLEGRFGPEVLYQDALELLVPKAYGDALESEKLEPIDEPNIEVVQMEKGKPLLFTAVVEVKPEVTLGEYLGVKVEIEVGEIGDEQVEEYLERTKQQHARLIDIEDSEVQNEDLVTIDFCGYIDGTPFEGGEAQDYSLEIGSNTFIPGFEEQLIGLKTGEEKEVKATFPEDYRKEDLAGKEALFKVTVKQIKRKQLPELNDDFAREVSDFDTFEEYKKDVLRRLNDETERKAKMDLENAVIEAVSQNSQVDIPEVLVERQLDRIIADMEQFLRFQGLNLDRYMEFTDKKIEDLRQENHEEAVKRVKANLVMDAIIKKEGIEVEDNEIDEKVSEYAKTYNDDPERIKEVFTKQGRLKMMEEEIRFRKAVDLLVEKADVTRKLKEKAE